MVPLNRFFCLLNFQNLVRCHELLLPCDIALSAAHCTIRCGQVNSFKAICLQKKQHGNLIFMFYSTMGRLLTMTFISSFVQPLKLMSTSYLTCCISRGQFEKVCMHFFVPSHGVQRRMISVDNFFVFLR